MCQCIAGVLAMLPYSEYLIQLIQNYTCQLLPWLAREKCIHKRKIIISLLRQTFILGYDADWTRREVIYHQHAKQKRIVITVQDNVQAVGSRREDARKNSTETENDLAKNVLQIIVILKYEYVSSSTLAGTKDDARVAENAGVVNILATPTTTAGSVSMSRNLILVHIEKLKLLNTMYKLKSREGMI